MSSISITAGVSLVNPRAIETVGELRAALDEANRQLLNAAMERARLLGALDDFGGVLEELVVANMNGDDEAVKARLDRLQKNLMHVGAGQRVSH
jgi:hypothetical protein